MANDLFRLTLHKSPLFQLYR